MGSRTWRVLAPVLCWLIAISAFQGVHAVADAAPAAPEQTPPPSYRDTVLGDEPSAYWTLDEAGPNVVDLAGDEVPASYGATAVAGGDPALADESGASVSAAHGETQFGSASDPVGTGATTVEFWHNSAEPPTGQEPGNGGQAPPRWLARWGGRGVSLVSGWVVVSDGTVDQTFYASPMFDAGSWHHWTITMGPGQEPELRIDGQRMPKFPYPVPFVAPAVPTGHPAFELSTGGAVDEVALFPRILSEAQIQAHWAKGVGIEECPDVPEDPTGYLAEVLADEPSAAYDFEERPETGVDFRTPIDVSGNCRHGSMLGPARTVGSGLADGGDGVAGAVPGPGEQAQQLMVLLDRADPGTEQSLEFWSPGGLTALDERATASAVNQFGILGAPDGTNIGFLDGSWHHFVLVVDEDEARFYVDGDLTSTADPEAIPLFDATVLLLEDTPNGGVDAVATYETALSAERIAAHYRAGLSDEPPECADESTSMYARAIAPDAPLAHLDLDDRKPDGSLPFFASDVADPADGCATARYGPNAAPNSADAAITGPAGSVTVAGASGTDAAAWLRTTAPARTADWWFRTDDAAPGWMARWGGSGLWWTGTGLMFTSHVPEGDTTGYEFPAETDLMDGGWHHLAIVANEPDGLGIKLLIDGEVVRDWTNGGWTGDPFSSVTLGGVPGDYDELAVYPTALTDAKVRAHSENARAFRTVTTLTADPDSWIAGLDVTLHAEVAAPEAPVAPGGQIRFWSGSQELDTVDIEGGGAELVIEDVAARKHRVRAEYLPASGYAPSSSPVLTRTARVEGELTLTADRTEVVAGDEIEFTASVGPVPGEAGAATGEVSFSVGDGDPVDVGLEADGVATWVEDLPVGEHVVTASYAGDADHPAVSDTVTVTVAPRGVNLGFYMMPRWGYADGPTRSFWAWTTTDAGAQIPELDVALRLDGDVVQTTTSGAYGQFQLTMPSVGVGSHAFVLEVSDPDGVYETVEYPLPYDGVRRPVIEIDLPEGPLVGAPHPFTFTAALEDGTPLAGTLGLHLPSGRWVGWASSEADGHGTGAIHGLPEPSNELSYSFRADTAGAPCIYDSAMGDACGGVGPGSGTAGTVLQEPTPTSVRLSFPRSWDGVTTLEVNVDSVVQGMGAVRMGTVEVDIDGETTTYEYDNGPVNAGSLAPGTHDIAVRYLGNAAWEPSTASLEDEYIKSLPTMELSVAPDPVVVGEPVDLQVDLSDEVSDEFGGTVTLRMEGPASFQADGSLTDVEVPADGRVRVPGRFTSSGQVRIVASTSGDADHYMVWGEATIDVVGHATVATLSLDPGTVDRGEPVQGLIEIHSTDPEAEGDPVGRVVVVDEANRLFVQTDVQPGVEDGVSRLEFVLPTGELARGTHTLQLSFSGRDGFGASAATASLAIDRSQSRVDVAFDPGSVAWAGETVEATATANPKWGDTAGTVAGPAVDLAFDGEPFGASTGDLTAAGTFEVPLGSHELTATFAGSSGWAGSVRQVEVLGVPRFDVDLSVPETSPRFGWFNATIDARVGSAPLTGHAMVYLFDGDQLITTARALSFPVEVTASGLAGGDHDLRAAVCPIRSSDHWTSFGECQVEPVESPEEPHTVVRAATEVLRWEGSGTGGGIRATEPFTLDARILRTGGAWVTGGTATFRVDGVALEPVAIGTNGIARLSHDGLPAGQHEISVSYSGTDDLAPTDDDDPSSTFLLSLQRVGVELTATAPSDILSGKRVEVAVSATVDPIDRPALDGTIKVRRVTAPFEEVGRAEMVDGAATVDLGMLPVGLHTLQVAYDGENGRYASDTAPIDIRVNKATSTTELRVAPDQPEPGDDVVLTALVEVETGSTWDPEGDVSFFDDGDQVDGPLDNSDPLDEVSVDPDTGEATFTVENLEAGPHRFRAVYQGNGHISGSQAAAVSMQALALPEISVSTSGPSVVGEPVDVEIEVTSGIAPAPTGQLTLMVDGDPMAPIDLVDGAATTTVTFDDPGDRPITVSYPGDHRHHPAEADAIQSVAKADTSIEVTAPARAGRGDPVEVSVKVSADEPGGGFPAGTVTLSVDGTDTGVEITLDGTGSGSGVIESLTEGTRTISARYGGSARYRPSEGQAERVAVRPATRTVLSTSPAEVNVGSTLTLTARVTVRDTAEPATGKVAFRVNGTTVRTVDLVDGVAVHPVIRPDAGSLQVEALLVENDALHSSRDEMTVVVQQATVSVATTLNAGSIPVGGTALATATVTSNVANRLPTGHVRFTVDGQNLGSSPVDSNGIARFNLNGLGLGTHDVVATYLGDAAFQEKASAPVPLAVQQAPTALSFTSSANPAVVDGPLLVKVRVGASPASAGTPHGTVVLRDESETVDESAVLVDGVATFDLSALPVGAYALEARFEGAGSFAASSWTPFQQVVGRPVDVALSVAPGQSPYTYGDQVEFEVAVTPLSNGPAPSGKVELRTADGRIGAQVDLDGGTATFVRPLPAAGSLELFALYLGDATYGRTDGDDLGLTVAKRATSTNLAVRATSGSGRSTEAAVTVTATGLAVQGSVQILDADDTVVATGSVAGGTGRIAVRDLASGAHQLRARFVEGPNFLASTSTAKTHTVVTPVVASAEVQGVAPTSSGDYRVTAGPDGSAEITFDGTASSGPGSVFHAWDFGEPVPPDHDPLTDPVIRHRFAKAGVYRVTLTVRDHPTNADQLDRTTLRVVVMSNEAAFASAGDDSRVVTEDELVWFDSSGSRPAIGADVLWEFPGNNFSDDPRASFRFDTPGDYTVRLDVSANGTAATAQVKVKVLKAVVNDGLHVTVREKGNGPLIAGAEVVVVDGVNRFSATTDSHGVARLRGLANAKYTVYGIAQGYSPGMKETTVDHSYGTATVEIERGYPLGSAVLNAELVDPSRYEALGIADTDANSIITEYLIHLDFVEPGEPGEPSKPVYMNGSGDCVLGCQIYTDGDSHWEVKEAGPGMVTAIGFPATTSYLKQFFEVELTVINLTPGDYSFSEGTAVLDVPAGLSLADLTSHAQSYDVDMDDIPSGESRTTSWILRGDTRGSYHLSAKYSAVLAPFSSPVNLFAETTQPIEVADSSDLELTVETDNRAYIDVRKFKPALPGHRGQSEVEEIEEFRYSPYDIRKLNFTNTSSTSMYNVYVDTQSAGSGFARDPKSQMTWNFPVIRPGETVTVGPITLAPLLLPGPEVDPEEPEDPEAPGEDPGDEDEAPGLDDNVKDAPNYDTPDKPEAWKDHSRGLDLADSWVSIAGEHREGAITSSATAPHGRTLYIDEGGAVGTWPLVWDPNVAGVSTFEILQAEAPGEPFEVIAEDSDGHYTVHAENDEGGIPGVFTVVAVFPDGSRKMLHKTIIGYSTLFSPVQIWDASWTCGTLSSFLSIDWNRNPDPVTKVLITSFPIDPDSLEAETLIAMAEAMSTPEPFSGEKFEDTPLPPGADKTILVNPSGETQTSIDATHIFGEDPPDFALIAVRVKTAGGQVSEPVMLGATSNCEGDYETLTPEDSLGAFCELFTAGVDTTNEANPTTDCPADPVNMATGNLVSRKIDADLPGPGAFFEFERVYNSLDDEAGVLGKGWSHRYEARITTGANGAVAFHGGSGSQIRFKEQPDGTYKAVSPTSMVLAKVLVDPLDPDSGYEWDATTLGGRKWHFDGTGRLKYVHDRNGEGPSMTYTGGKLSKVSYNGWDVDFTYTGALLQTVSVLDTWNIRFDYQSGRLWRVRDVNGLYTFYGYDSRGRLSQERDNTNSAATAIHTTTYEDKDKGRVISQRDALGGMTYFGWVGDKGTGRATMTDARGKIWTQDYVGYRLVKRTDPLGRETRTQYDHKHRVSAVIDGRNNATRTYYDDKGNKTRRTTPIPGAHDEEWTYYDNGRLKTSTDVSGRETRYGYDSLGRMTNVIGPGVHRTVTRFNSRGLPDWICQGTACRDDAQDVDGDGAFKYQYDSHGRPTRLTSPNGRITRIDYSADMRTVDTYGPRAEGEAVVGYRTQVVFDASGRPVTENRPNNISIATQWNQRNNVRARWDNNGYRIDHYYYATGELERTVEMSRGTGTHYQRDANGNVTAETSPMGRVTTFRYDDANQLIGKTEPLGNAGGGAANWSWIYAYDDSGNLTEVTQPDGYKTTTKFDAGNRPTEMNDSLLRQTKTSWYPDGTPKVTTDADNKTTKRFLDGTGRLDYEVDELGNTTKYTYTSTDAVASVKNADGTTKYSYDRDGLMTEVIAPRGVATSTPNDFRTVIGRDQAGNASFVVDAGGGRTEYTYDGNNRMTAFKDAADQTTTITYDRQDRPLVITRPRATPYESPSTTTYSYPDYGLTTKVTALDRTYIERRDFDGFVKEEETNLGVTSYTRDANGRVLTSVEPGASGPATTTYSYSRTGSGSSTRNLAVMVDPLGRQTRTTTDVLGQLRSQRNASGGLTEYEYTDGGRLRSVTGAETASPVSNPSAPGARPVETFAYQAVSLGNDEFGEKTTRTDALGKDWVSVTDAAGRTVSSETAAKRKTTREYDEAGNLVKEIAPGNLVTTYEWSPRNEILEIDGPGTAPVNFTYNTAGRMTSVTASNGGTTSFEHDARGNVSKRTGPDGTFELYVYDAADRLAQYTGQGGNREWYAYDPQGRFRLKQTQLEEIETFYDGASNVARRTGKKYAGNVISTNTYTYDQVGQLTSSTGQTGTTTYQRNSAGQVSKVTNPDGSEIGYTWAPDGSRETMSMDDDVTVRTDYRLDGAERRVKHELPDGQSSTRNFTYDADGLMLTEDIEGWEYRAYERDAATGQPTLYTQNTGSELWTENLTWSNGRLASRGITEGDGTAYDVDYGYDNAGQLTSEVTTGDVDSERRYGYTSYGALDWREDDGVLTDFSYNAARRLTSAVSPTENRTFTYDHVGRRSTDKVTGGAQKTFAYDGFGRQTTSTLTQPGRPAATQTLAYDGEDRLSSMTGQEAVPGATGQTLTLSWDTQTAVPEVLRSEGPDNRTLMGYAGGRRIGMTTLSTGPEGEMVAHSGGFAYDFLGNPVQMMTEEEDYGALVQDAYGPYGEGEWKAPIGFGYQGELAMFDGLVHLRARNYDPTTASFTSRDPLEGVIGTTTLTNPFAYANNDPINQHDPLGLRSECTDNSSEAFKCGVWDGLKDTPFFGPLGRTIFDSDYRDKIASQGFVDSWRMFMLGDSLDYLSRNPDQIIPAYRDGFIALKEQIFECMDKGMKDDSCGSVGATAFLAMMPSAKITGPGKLTKTIGRINDIPTVKRINDIRKRVPDLLRDSKVVRGLNEVRTKISNARTKIKNFPKKTVDTAMNRLKRNGGAASTAPKTRRGKSAGGGGSKACSFAGETLVLMADGTRKRIEDIEVGDVVLATEPETGRTVGRAVTHLWVHQDTVLDLDVGGDTIATTEDHPFWNESDHKWQRADQLDAGDLVRSGDGASLQVDGLDEETARRALAFNLTVDDLHTYFVAAGDDSVLVHNTDPFCSIPQGSTGGESAFKHITPAMRRDYFPEGQDVPLCAYCRMNPAEALDHVEPRSKGGNLTEENVTGACTRCNSSKRDRVAPVTPPEGFTGAWPPEWWPPRMKQWWDQTYGQGS